MSEEEFFDAIRSGDLVKIRELAPLFDLNRIRWKEDIAFSTPLLLSMKYDIRTDVMELLLSLGAVPSPLDAFVASSKCDSYIYNEYIRHLKTHGYNIYELRETFFKLDYEPHDKYCCWWSPTIDGPFPESDEEEEWYSDTDSDVEEKATV